MENNKKLSKIIVVIAIIILLTTNVYASSVYIEGVKEEGSPILINKGKVTNSITNIDNENKEVKMELKVEAGKLNEIKDNTEIIFLIDDSTSMNTQISNNNNITRKTNVINATKKLIENINNNNSEIKMGIVYFGSSASVLSELTTNKEDLLAKLNSFKSKVAKGNTAVEAGLSMAKSKFSTDSNNRIIILLTDGVPTDDFSEVKNSLQDDNFYIITTLVGFENATQDEKDIIFDVFGTEENPIPDKLYNITDIQVEDTIATDIYQRVINDFKETIKNIIIENEFSYEIMANFDIEMENNEEVNMENEKILWNISNLQSLESKTLKYTLKLKSNFDENIINKVLDTSKNVQIQYNDVQNINKLEVMESIPQIILKQDEEVLEETNDQESENTEEMNNENEEKDKINEKSEDIEEQKNIDKEEERQENNIEEEQILEEIEKQENEQEKTEIINEQIEEQKEDNTEKEETEEMKEDKQEKKEIGKIVLEEKKNDKSKAEDTSKTIETESQDKINIDNKNNSETKKAEEKNEVITQKSTNVDTTTANKPLAYTGTNNMLIIGIIVLSIFAIYEGINYFKIYNK